MSSRPIRKSDHRLFCLTEAWELVRDASGKPVGHHETYRLRLWDGRVLRTRISRPVDDHDYGVALASHILREQLDVTGEEFWACVREGTLPDRGAQPQPDLVTQLPLGLLKQLTDQLGIPEEDAVRYGLDEALEAIKQYWLSRGNEGAGA